MHPILVGALAEDQHRSCPCGAVTQLPYRLCPRLPPTAPGDAGPRDRSIAALAIECTPIPKRPALRAGGVTSSKHQQGMPGLMLTTLILIVLAAIVLVLILLAVVVVGIRQEPRSAELSDVAPSPITGLVRRLTGLSVRRPTPTAVRDREQGEGDPAGLAPRPRTTT